MIDHFGNPLPLYIVGISNPFLSWCVGVLCVKVCEPREHLLCSPSGWPEACQSPWGSDPGDGSVRRRRSRMVVFSMRKWGGETRVQKI